MPNDSIFNNTSSETAENQVLPALVIIDPDEARSLSYYNNLHRKFDKIEVFRFGNDALDGILRMDLKPSFVIISSFVGYESAEATIRRLRKLIPDVYILAVMKSEKDSEGVGIIEAFLLGSGANHVVSRYDLGEDYVGIVEAVNTTLTKELKPKLLIVDAEHDRICQLKEELEDKYNVFPVSFADKALALMVKFIPDVIIVTSFTGNTKPREFINESKNMAPWASTILITNETLRNPGLFTQLALEVGVHNVVTETMLKKGLININQAVDMAIACNPNAVRNPIARGTPAECLGMHY